MIKYVSGKQSPASATLLALPHLAFDRTSLTSPHSRRSYPRYSVFSSPSHRPMQLYPNGPKASICPGDFWMWPAK